MINTAINSHITLNSIREQFEAWRRDRSNRREPIPQHLWQAAVELCNTHNITRVYRTLRLSSSELKKRILPKAVEPQFMELDIASVTGPWRLECDRADGARLRFSGSGQSPDIETLLGVFLS